MLKVKITKIFRKKVDTKYGEKLSCGIKTEQHGDKWINGFENQITKDWKIGDEVNILITEKKTNGNVYLNYKTPKTEGMTESQVRQIIKEEINRRMSNLFKYLKECGVEKK